MAIKDVFPGALVIDDHVKSTESCFKNQDSEYPKITFIFLHTFYKRLLLIREFLSEGVRDIYD